MKKLITVLVITFAAISVHAQTTPLEIKTITVGPLGLHANMVMIIGEEGLVLVDAPFSRSDTHRLIAEILDTGKRLDTVIITHDHPDHFFGLDLVMDSFPNARVIAHEQVVRDIWRSAPLKVERWNPMLGDNAPRYSAVPTPMEENHIVFEGHRIEILGPMQGDHKSATAVWIPGMKALITGDLLFDNVFLWMGETLKEQRLAWRDSVLQLQKLNPEIVVAGHKPPGTPDRVEAFDFTLNYMETFERLVDTSKDSKDLSEKLKKAFPETIDVLDDFILSYSTKVAMGEIPPWDE